MFILSENNNTKICKNKSESLSLRVKTIYGSEDSRPAFALPSFLLSVKDDAKIMLHFRISKYFDTFL